MDIKPAMSQGPTVQTYDQNAIETAPNKKSEEQPGSETAGNAQTTSNTVQAMKQAGTEAKGSMKTSENFLRQSLTDHLERKVSQNEERSPGLMDWPKSQEAGKGGNATPLFGSPVMSANSQPQAGSSTAVTKSGGDPTAAARKEAQALMKQGNKMLKEHRYNEAIEV